MAPSFMAFFTGCRREESRASIYLLRQYRLYTVHSAHYTVYNHLFYTYFTLILHLFYTYFTFLSKKNHISKHIILLTKTTAAQNEVALSYHIVRGLYFLAVVSMRSILPVKLL